MPRLWTLAIVCLLAGASAQQPAPSNEARTAARLERIRAQPEALQAFLAAMPKGGDLHNHLSGAVYAESWIHWATQGGLCADAVGQLSAPPCASGKPPVNENDDAQRQLLLKAWSMSGFVPNAAESGHDHFFATFDKFDPAEDGHIGDALAEVADRAAHNNEIYLELMETWNGAAAIALANKIRWTGDLAAMQQAIETAGLAQVVTGAMQEIDTAEAQQKTDLRCGTPQPAAGCGVQVRYLYQVLRGLPPSVVYTQLLLGYALANTDPRVVGVNLVMPEDGFTSMRDFDLHMRMIAFLHKTNPQVGISLHAGELTQALVPPEGLRNHIRDSVEIAGATRIGHGVDVMHEDRPLDLLAELARNHVLVEICLTSNAGILGVEGPAHPLPAYLRAHVPVALATDDEGVSRSGMTEEYMRAEEAYALPYATLKAMAEASLEHAFVLRVDKDKLTRTLSAEFAQFEAQVAAGKY